MEANCFVSAEVFLRHFGTGAQLSFSAKVFREHLSSTQPCIYESLS